MSVSEILDKIVEYLPAIFSGIKSVLLFFIIALFVSIIVVIIRSWEYLSCEYHEKRWGADFPKHKPRKLKKKWDALEKQMESHSESAGKLAIIEAGKIINDILDKAGYPGETMSERLDKITEAQISNIYDLRKASRLRNTIVHDMDVEISRHQTKEAFKIFEKTLEELEAI